MPHSAEQGLVSVVMIFRDAAQFFDEAVESVLAQTHARVELLLCDDGSTDPSTAMAQGWAAGHPDRVRYLEHPGHAHRGMSSTRNLGIAAARGEFVAFLDADDRWGPDHLGRDVALLESNPTAGFVCGGALDWYSWADPGTADVPSPLPFAPGRVVPPPLMLNAVLRNGSFSTPTCSLLVRRQILTDVGGSEDAFRAMFEDQVLLAKLYLSHSCVVSGAEDAWYRRHPNSSSAQAIRAGAYHPERPNPSYEAYLRWLSEFVQDQQGEDYDELRRLLQIALQPYDGSPAAGRRRLVAAIRSSVPPPARRLIRGGARRIRALGPVRMGSLRRLTPLSRQFGYDRGQPIDRYYVERFLTQQAHLIAGRVLEVGDSEYTRRFGAHRVTRADVLNIDGDQPETTIVADLADASGIPSSTFDCLVITQTLHLIYDLPAAARTLHRILRPGGTLLATFPGISPVSADRWAETWYWALTPLAAVRLFAEAFGAANVEVRAHGNVLTSVAFLEGLATGELRQNELDTHDPQFPMLVTVRAFKADNGAGPGNGDRVEVAL